MVLYLNNEKDRIMKLKEIFIEGTNNTAIQFFRSLFVGGIATAADMAVLIAVRELFKLPEDICAVIGFVFGLTVNYIVSNLWVFSKAKVKNRALDFIAFAVIGIIGLGLTQLIIAPFSMEGIFGEGILVKNKLFGSLIPTDKYYIIGKLISVVLVYMWNFFARKFFLYNHTEEKNETEIKQD